MQKEKVANDDDDGDDGKDGDDGVSSVNPHVGDNIHFRGRSRIGCIQTFPNMVLKLNKNSYKTFHDLKKLQMERFVDIIFYQIVAQIVDKREPINAWNEIEFPRTRKEVKMVFLYVVGMLLSVASSKLHASFDHVYMSLRYLP